MSNPIKFQQRPDLLIKFPTRNRPEKFFDALDKYYALLSKKHHVRFLITCDIDDESMNNSKVRDKFSSYPNLTVKYGDNETKIEAINADLNNIPFHIILLASDDMIPEAQGYDDIIITDMQRHFPNYDGVVWYNDGVQGSRLNTLCILGRRYYDRFGYIYNPEYKSFWCDNEFTVVSQLLNKAHYSDKCIIRHMHHSVNKDIEKDNLYQSNLTYLSEDESTFHRRKAKNFTLNASPINIITIINYPDTSTYNKMSCVCLKQLATHNPTANIFVLYEKQISSSITQFCNQYSNIKLVQRESHKRPFADFHNIKFKLHVLSQIKEPFIFVDADIFCLSNLDYLWDRRNDKPFIGINHQFIPGHSDLMPYPFLNSGVQVVGDPEWYSYEKIAEVCIRNGRFTVPGRDQAALFDYCKSINYDYTHPEVGYEWNSCAGYTKILKDQNNWVGLYTGPHDKAKPDSYQVYMNHYWNEFKPWNINCPIYNTEKV